jgi:hypothetical protein
MRLRLDCTAPRQAVEERERQLGDFRPVRVEREVRGVGIRALRSLVELLEQVGERFGSRHLAWT